LIISPQPDTFLAGSDVEFRWARVEVADTCPAAIWIAARQ
jgi:hypothetical protein